MGLGFVNANDFGHGINLLVRLSLVKPSLESVDKLPSASKAVGLRGMSKTAEHAQKTKLLHLLCHRGTSLKP
jgi:hypothetical protein